MIRSNVPILKIGSNLIVTIQVDLHDKYVDQFQKDVLASIEKNGTTGLIIEISSLDTVDSYVASALVNTSDMGKLMGSKTVIVGMRPEVAVTLTRMGYAIEGVQTALNLEEGLALLKHNLDPQ